MSKLYFETLLCLWAMWECFQVCVWLIFKLKNTNIFSYFRNWGLFDPLLILYLSEIIKMELCAWRLTPFILALRYVLRSLSRCLASSISSLSRCLVFLVLIVFLSSFSLSCFHSLLVSSLSVLAMLFAILFSCIQLFEQRFDDQRQHLAIFWWSVTNEKEKNEDERCKWRMENWE